MRGAWQTADCGGLRAASGCGGGGGRNSSGCRSACRSGKRRAQAASGKWQRERRRPSAVVGERAAVVPVALTVTAAAEAVSGSCESGNGCGGGSGAASGGRKPLWVASDGRSKQLAASGRAGHTAAATAVGTTAATPGAMAAATAMVATLAAAAVITDNSKQPKTKSFTTPWTAGGPWRAANVERCPAGDELGMQ